MEAKALIVEPNGKGLYRVRYTGGGGVPADLSGLYTSYAAGVQAIAVFQSSVRASPDIKYTTPAAKAAKASNGKASTSSV